MELTELSWTATPNKEWIKVNPSSGKGSRTVNVKITDDGAGFKGNIEFKYGKKVINVDVTRCPSYRNMYLTFKPSEDSKFKFSGHSVSYSLDEGQTWTSLASNTNSPTISEGSKIVWKANLTPSENKGIGIFSSTGNFLAEGNPLSLVYGDNFGGINDISDKEYIFHGLFSGCSKITDAKNVSLPSTVLSKDCYFGMFRNCTNLSVVPALPATTLAESCYAEMFYGCTSLTTTPELSATTLADACYENMFSNCTSLTIAPELPATTLAKSCYHGMFFLCTNLTTAPRLPATTLAEFCYSSMFNSCTSLTIAPELPATTLVNGCYHQMFDECENLEGAPELPATSLADSCYYLMFRNTSLTTAPVLSATTLTNYCYYAMFQGCTKLKSVTCLATNISAYRCTYKWVSGVASSGSFTKAASMSSWTRGDNGIPNGWTVVDES